MNLNTVLEGKVGVEIEFTSIDDHERWEHIAHNIFPLPETVWVNFWERKGVPVSYNFHLTHDGSVTDYGYELQTRPFCIADQQYLKLLQKALDIIREHGGYVNDTCGLHIHINGLGLSPVGLKNLVLFYMTWQPIFYAVIHTMRVLWMYCKPIPNDTTAYYTVRGTRSPRGLRQLLTSRRYFINLQNWHRYRHYEIRAAQGSLNFNRIINWVLLHLKVLQYIQQQKETLDYRQPVSRDLHTLDRMLDLIYFSEAKEYFQQEYKYFRGNKL